MPAFRSIRTRRGKRKINKGFELQLTSLIDVLVIILVFLLKSYQTSLNTLTTVEGLQMPISASQDEPHDSLQVIITPEGITFEGKRVVDFAQSGDTAGSTEGAYKLNATDLDEGGRRIVGLFNTLVAAREKSELLKAKSPVRDANGNPLPFDGVLAVTADKRIQYDTLRKIMYTAGAAGFKVFRFIALKKET
ncbi:MAG: biopolymer transporter ExbD [Bdellovibrionales bacterium]|nr:biopolymer transporter ExbD [Bdellovibrionales bacterium]